MLLAMFNGYDPLLVYLNAMINLLKCKLQSIVSRGKGWEVLGMWAVLQQPRIVVGLFFERSNSITREVLLQNEASFAVAIVIAICTVLVVPFWMYKFFRGWNEPPPQALSTAFLFLAMGMFANALIAANAAVLSPVLIVEYGLSAVSLALASFLIIVSRHEHFHDRAV